MSGIPQHTDPNVGTVFGNILDQFDSPTYNLRLFMLREEQSRNASSEFGILTDGSDINPSDTVILAQTGVTGTQIDDLEIHSLVTTFGPVAQRVSFRIEQPGAASFLDQVQLAKAYLGHPASATPTMFLEVRFQGYEESLQTSNWDPDSGGKPTQIAGPYRYKLQLTNINASITAAGSSYEIECVSMSTYAFRDHVFKFPNTVTTSGTTIDEHAKVLETKLNEIANRGPGIPDEYVIDTSQLIGTGAGGTSALDKITDQSLYDPVNDPLVEGKTSVALNTRDAEIRQSADLALAVEESSGDTGTAAEAKPAGVVIHVEPGTTIESYFESLLNMNREFQDKITRRQQIDNPDSPIDAGRGFNAWVKLNAVVEQLQYDESRSDYAHRYTYVPVLYKDARNDIAVDAKELNFTTDEGQTRIEQIIANGSLKKAYEYFFTGRNDQVLNLDIRYDNGIALLLAPKGGTIGSYSTSDPGQNAQAIPAAKDITDAGLAIDLFNTASLSTARDSIGSALDSLLGLANNVRDTVVSELAGALNQAPGQILDAVTGLNEQNRLALIDTIARRGVTIAQADSLFDTSVPTEPSATTQNADGSSFTPQLSGFAYSADLLNPKEQFTDIQALVDKGYIRVNQAEEDIDLKQSKEFKTLPDATKTAAFEQFTPRNTLFGLVAAQHADQAFLLQIDLTLRGDPWYLGSPGIAASTDEQANFNKDDNCFWLRIQSPLTYDPDWTDEDSPLNSGYWRFDGISRTFSGCYRMVRCVNSFSGGRYTVDVQAQRIIPFDKVPASQSATDAIQATTTVVPNTNLDVDPDRG